MIIDFTGKYVCDLGDSIDCTENIETIENYYYLYEYTDNIQLIVDNPQYPSMLNYVKTGILTEKEMVQALLYKE